MQPKTIIITTAIALLYDLIYFTLIQETMHDSLMYIVFVIFSLVPFYTLIVLPSILIAHYKFGGLLVLRFFLAITLLFFSLYSYHNFKVAMIPSLLLILIPSFINLFKGIYSRNTLDFFFQILLGILPIILFFFLFPSFFMQRNSYRCPACLSKKDCYQYLMEIGNRGPKIALDNPHDKIFESETCRLFLKKQHVHQWNFMQGSPYLLPYLTWSGCAIGGNRRASEFGEAFEQCLDFRMLILKKIEKKELNEQEVLIFLLMPCYKPEKGEEFYENFEENEIKMKKLVNEIYAQI